MTLASAPLHGIGLTEVGSVRLLVVDDEQTDLLAVRRALAQSPIPAEIDEATSAAEAMERVASTAYDCILLDYYLPGVEGLALLEEVRGAATGSPPIVIFTGRGDEDVAVELMKAGVADYLPKASLTAERLAASVRHALEIARAGAARAAAERDLRESRERLRAALDAAGAGTFHWSVDDDALDWDDHARALLGLAAGVQATTLQDFLALIDPRDRDRVARSWRAAADGGAELREEFRLFSTEDGGAARWLQQRARVRPARDGAPRRLVGAVTDVTEEKRRVAQLQKAVRARDEVLSIVSHDLRNPVSTIHMVASLLSEVELGPEEREKQFEVLRRVAGEMMRLIDDLLDLSKAESGHLAIAPASEEVRELVRAAVDAFELHAADVGIALHSEVEPGLPPVYADRHRVRQVLANLLDNALKFTPRGGRITVRAERDEDAVCIVVEDTGPGIPAEDRERVFDRFWQARHTGHAGAGLGLAIARSIVEEHGGRIWVDGAEGAGTRFCFTLPVLAGEARADASGPPEDSS